MLPRSVCGRQQRSLGCASRALALLARAANGDKTHIEKRKQRVRNAWKPDSNSLASARSVSSSSIQLGLHSASSSQTVASSGGPPVNPRRVQLGNDASWIFPSHELQQLEESNHLLGNGQALRDTLQNQG